MNAQIYSDHALLQAHLTTLRSKNTSKREFAHAMDSIAVILAALVSADLDVQTKKISTPLASARGVVLKRPIVLVPVLRAGLGLLGGFQSLFADAAVGHIGVERDHETLKPKLYYFKMPLLKGTEVFLLDPMLATGGSLDFAIERLQEQKPHSIRSVSVLASPEGLRLLSQKHATTKFYAAALDSKLNAKGYILPGLGDAGDRYFGT